MAPSTGLRPSVQGTSAQADNTVQPNQQKSGAPVLEDSFFSDTDSGEQKEATAGKKVLPLWFLSMCDSIWKSKGSNPMFFFFRFSLTLVFFYLC